jgi:hypothetical protein
MITKQRGIAAGEGKVEKSSVLLDGSRTGPPRDEEVGQEEKK